MNRLLAVLFSLLLSGGLAATELSPETYVRADIEARQATLEGMEARLARLQQGADPEVQAQQDEASRHRVDAVFETYGTTGPAHAVYGSRHGEDIAGWLAANPSWQQQYDDLTVRFEALSQQFDALLGGNP